MDCHDSALPNLAMTGGDSSLQDSLANPANEHSEFLWQYIFRFVDCFGDSLKSPRNDE